MNSQYCAPHCCHYDKCLINFWDLFDNFLMGYVSIPWPLKNTISEGGGVDN